jgi:AcrR family transcriptional regulator
VTAEEIAPQGKRAKKAELTRRNLMAAARAEMARGGSDSLTIASITAAADIAQGTFYNYFTNREEIIDAVIIDEVESLGNRLDRLTAGMTDAAEIYSFSLRHLMHTAVTDPVWGWLVVRLGIAQQGLLSQLGPRAARDLQIGIDSGRFDIPDLSVATAATFGSLLAVMRDYLRSDDKTDPSDIYAESLLRMVGIPAAEAKEISRRELPELPE